MKIALKIFLLSLLSLTPGIDRASAQPQPEVQLHWLEGKAPATSPGVTWGVPWPRGTVRGAAAFTVQTASGEAVPVQSWPTAIWPDGSIKWSAHAIGADAGLNDALELTPGRPEGPKLAVTVAESDESTAARSVTIDTGVMQCRVAGSARTIIESVTRDGKELARNGRMVCLRQDQAEAPAEGALQGEAFTGEISSVTVEQRGPVRAVVEIEGKHANEDGRAWLPFVVRLYFL